VSIGQPLLALSVSVDYRNKPNALRNVSLEIGRDEILGLAGLSGSGKSTLALSILGLLSLKGGKVRGQIHFQGQDLAVYSQTQLRHVRGREISIVLQSPMTSLNPILRIGTQLREAWRAHAEGSPQDREAAICAALHQVGLPHDKEFLKRRPSQLSVGQAQRVTIAMAIMHRPSLLIADEATSALDTISHAEILRLFARLNREMHMAILYISHDLLSISALCHRIAILLDGQIVECGSTSQIFCTPQHTYTQLLVSALPRVPYLANSPEPNEDSLTKLVGEAAP
jgi:ABC-type dipeptide/oligopeptide/nickel transport system ATPase component